jgi:hypothetical protein
MDQEVRWLLTEKLLHVRTGPVNPREDEIRRRSVALASFNSRLEALRYQHHLRRGVASVAKQDVASAWARAS